MKQNSPARQRVQRSVIRVGNEGTMARGVSVGLLIGRMRCAMTGAFGIVLAAVTNCHSSAHGADIELGRYLSTECITCHGGAQKHNQIPDIFGHAEGTFEQVLKAYRDKLLDNQVMQTVASRLTDEEIAALAAFFAKTKRPQ
jgi:cytochrome c553